MQVPIPGGPARKSPELRARAQETVQQRELQAVSEGPERSASVDKTRFSRELTEELGKAGDPQGNADQLIQAIQGMSENRLDQQQPGQKPPEIGAARGIDGDSKKRKPRISGPRDYRASLQAPPRGKPDSGARAQPQQAPPDRAADRLELSPEAAERMR